MQRHLGLLGALALSMAAAGLVTVLLDIDVSQPWQAGVVVVIAVVVLLEALSWLRRRRAPEAAAVGPADLPDDVRRTISTHLADRRPIEAVKVYRQATGAGLVDAKRAIDSWPAA